MESSRKELMRNCTESTGLETLRGYVGLAGARRPERPATPGNSRVLQRARQGGWTNCHVEFRSRRGPDFAFPEAPVRTSVELFGGVAGITLPYHRAGNRAAVSQ